MIFITIVLLIFVSSSFCVPHYRPSPPFYPSQPIWSPFNLDPGTLQTSLKEATLDHRLIFGSSGKWTYPRLALAQYLVDGRYQLRQHPYDGLENVLAAYNVSEDAIKIIRESVEVVEISCDGDGELTISMLPGVFVARVPQKVSVRSKAGEVVDYENPITGEDSNFSWRLLSPVSLVTKVVGNMSGLVEMVTWTFSSYGAQSHTVVVKGGLYLAVAQGWWLRTAKVDKGEEKK